MVVVVSTQLTPVIRNSVSNISSQGGILIQVDLFASESSIDWGTLEPGENKTTNIEVTNIGNVPLNLYLSTANWSSVEAQNVLSLSWNYSEAKIQPQVVTPLALTLSVASDPQGVENFSFDIIITGM